MIAGYGSFTRRVDSHGPGAVEDRDKAFGQGKRAGGLRVCRLRDLCSQTLAHVVRRQASADQEQGGTPFLFFEQPQKQVNGLDLGRSHPPRPEPRGLDSAAGTRG